MGYKLKTTAWLSWNEFSEKECANYERSKKITDKQFLDLDRENNSALINGSAKKPYHTTLVSCSCPQFNNPAVFSTCKHMFALAKRLGYFAGVEYLNVKLMPSQTKLFREEQIMDNVTSTELNTKQFGRFQLSYGSFPLLGFNEAIELRSNDTGNSFLFYFLIGLTYIYLVPIGRSFEIPIQGLDCSLNYNGKEYNLDKIYDSDWGKSVARFSDKATNRIIDALIQGGDFTISLSDERGIVGSMIIPKTDLFANTYAAVFLEDDLNSRFNAKIKQKDLLFEAIDLSDNN